MAAHNFKVQTHPGLVGRDSLRYNRVVRGMRGWFLSAVYAALKYVNVQSDIVIATCSL